MSVADQQGYMRAEPDPDEEHGYHVQAEEEEQEGDHRQYHRGQDDADDRGHHGELDMEEDGQPDEEEEGGDAAVHQQAAQMGLGGHQGYLQFPLHYRRDEALDEEEQQRMEEQQRGQLLQYTALGGQILDSHSLNLALAQQQLAHQQLAQQQLAQQQLAQQQLAQQHLVHQQMGAAGPGMQHGETVPIMALGKPSKKRRKLKRLEIDLDPICRC